MGLLRLAPDVFFRLTPANDILLYQTSQQKVFLLDNQIYELLTVLQQGISAENLLSVLNAQEKKYNSEILEQTIQQLFEIGIATRETVLEERKRTLEASVKMSQYDMVNALFAVQFELTFRCNERCKHCYCPRDNDVSSELSTDEIKHVIDDLKEMNVVDLTFTGGDLFVRKDTFEILEYAYSLGFTINIFTNGTLLQEEDFYRLKKIYPRSVHFSIYNYIPEKHDAFTCLPGSFKKTTDAIKKCKLLGIPVNIKTSLVEENYDDVDGILNLAKELGTTIQVSLQVAPTNSGDMKSTEHRLRGVEQYADVMRRVNNQILLSCSGDFISTSKKDTERSICGAGAFSLNINPYGEVFPCNALLLSCGNIRKNSIRDIWNNSPTLKQVRGFRMDQLKGCENCEKKGDCDFCPGSALQETGEPLMRYSEACTITDAKIIKQKGEKKNVDD